MMVGKKRESLFFPRSLTRNYDVVVYLANSLFMLCRLSLSLFYVSVRPTSVHLGFRRRSKEFFSFPAGKSLAFPSSSFSRHFVIVFFCGMKSFPLFRFVVALAVGRNFHDMETLETRFDFVQKNSSTLVAICCQQLYVLADDDDVHNWDSRSSLSCALLLCFDDLVLARVRCPSVVSLVRAK